MRKLLIEKSRFYCIRFMLILTYQKRKTLKSLRIFNEPVPSRGVSGHLSHNHWCQARQGFTVEKQYQNPGII